jgi:hypothetical protein
MILRILAQESPDSKLRLKKIWTKVVQGAKIGIWKALGVYLELHRISSGLKI